MIVTVMMIMMTLLNCVTDMSVERPDKKSIMIYLACCYQVLTARNSSDNVSSILNRIVNL